MKFGSVSRERWKRLEPILDAALELEPAGRSAYLDKACGDDEALRAEVEALLAACDHSGSLLSAPAALTYGPLLTGPAAKLPPLLGGRYHVVREIGRGGMATVYLADEPKHGRQVAVKVLHSDVARLIGRERFLKEIEIAARLSHPHILPLHDSGEALAEVGGEHAFLYHVSPFVAGESLRDRLGREPALSIAEVIRLGREIATALDYAHRQGVIHLDVKPGNILLQDGHAVIADFGIARAISRVNEDAALDANVATTNDGGLFGAETLPLLGTPSYMSPEQAQGAKDVDGRSDVYSLGCVLYEMITGKRPFSRTHHIDLAMRMRVATRPDRGPLLERAPRELADVIVRAMSPRREDRYRTAGELATALGRAPVESHPRRRRLSKRLVGVGVALAAGVLLALRTTRAPAALDSNLIAVAPFDVEAPSLGLWKEGFVDVMSRNLDGAGALRAVPPTVVVRNWHGHADVAAARTLGEKTGARLVLFGGLLGTGDSVRAMASLLDTRTGKTIAEFEQRDVPERMDRISDSLTMEVLRELGRSRRIDMARATSSPTNSVAALKAYLQGEQFYRAAAWDSAQTRFTRAIQLDTEFTLAYHRLAAVRKWLDPREVPDSTTYELMRRTIHFDRQMAPHEHLLAVIDSLSAESYFAWRKSLMAGGDWNDEARLVQALYATLQRGVQMYPDDAELWLLLADARYRYDADVVHGELDDRAILALYDRAIALDSSFAPAYVTPISLAGYLDGPESARKYIHAYLALEPSGPHAQVIRLADLLLDSRRAASVDIDRLVDTSSVDRLCAAATLLRHVPDSAETLVRIASALAKETAERPMTLRQNCAFTQAMDGLQFRGHLREALRLTSLQAHGLRSTIVFNMARAHMLPTEMVRAEFKYVLSLAPRTTMTKLYSWWATDGDTAAIQTYLNVFNHALAKEQTHDDPTLLADVAAGRAYLALARRDTASALRLLLTTSDTLHECWYDNRVAATELLIAARKYGDAAMRLERRWPGTSGCGNGFDDVLWTMNRARMFERLGRRSEAAAEYAFVAAAWRTADAELQPYVREAQAGADRLR